MKLHPLRRAEDMAHSRRFRKGMYVLPSLFTCGNIAAGYYAISQAIQGATAWDGVHPLGPDDLLAIGRHFNYAAIAIGFAVLFDGLDGFIARMTNTASAFGKELDSLADVITFGVAPSVLAWQWGLRFLPPAMDSDFHVKLGQFGAIAGFGFLVACASRLARFNITTNPKPANPGRPGKKYFVGMPTPAGAGMIAATVHLVRGVPITEWWLGALWSVGVLVLGFLMVSTWRFWSSKNVDLRSRQPFQLFLFIGIMVAVIWIFSRYVLFAFGITYVLSGVLARAAYALRRGSRDVQPFPPPESTSGTA
jgi:CDP-diacylglycerol--serine O-phosphatidyltransferase